jgi:hypothetical protein
MRIGHALDWIVDNLLPFALVAALAGCWIAAVVILTLTAPWWIALLALALGLPFWRAALTA